MFAEETHMLSLYAYDSIICLYKPAISVPKVPRKKLDENLAFFNEKILLIVNELIVFG